MAGYKSAGTDLDSLLAPRNGVTKIADVGYSIGGSDISNLYSPASWGTAAANINYKKAGSDIGPLFASYSSVSLNQPPGTITNFATGSTFTITTAPTNGQSAVISYSGDRLYMVSFGGGVYQWTLTTPFNVTTATSVVYMSATPFFEGMCFKYDGTRMYIAGVASGTAFIRQYDLSTPWNVSTATAGTTYTVSTGVTGAVNGCCMPYGGNKFYISNGTNIYEYTFGTAYDIGTLTYAGTYNTTLTNFQVSAVSRDGTKIVGTPGIPSSNVRLFTMSTPYSISTSSLTQTLSLSAVNTGYATGCSFDNTGARMYVNFVSPTVAVYVTQFSH